MLMDMFTLDVSAIGGLTHEEFFKLASTNTELKLERTAQGEIIIMALTGGNTGFRNSILTARLTLWCLESKSGKVFDSSTGFKLLNGAVRSPDAAFVRKAGWEALSEAERSTFPPYCPDFVVELMSNSDNLRSLQEKMREWMENGCQLAWLIDTAQERVFIYRADASSFSVTTIDGFDAALSGETVLPHFIFHLAELRDESA
jgi:Uma2 family endonuclease